MNDTMGNEGVNKLAGVLQGRMKGISESPAVLDFGTINSDMSLTTNLFPQPIPKSDYMVCRQLTLGPKDDVLTKTQYIGKTTKDGRHSSHTATDQYGAHVHEVLIPENMRKLKAGDRVLVAWVGDDPCIVDLVLSGSSL